LRLRLINPSPASPAPNKGNAAGKGTAATGSAIGELPGTTGSPSGTTGVDVPTARFRPSISAR